MDIKSTHNINQEELDETLSFCDLSLENQDLDDHHQSLTSHHSPNSPSHDHEHFDFSFIPNTFLESSENDVVFCGKLMKKRDFVYDGDDGDQSRYIFPLSSSRQFKNNKNDLDSLYLVNSKPNSSLSSKNFRSQSYSSSRKHKVLIGITKLPSRMELSDIKKRQSRRNHPLRMFPVVAADNVAVVDTDDGCCTGGKRWHIWSILKPLRCKAHIFNALGKASLGCIPRV